MSEKFCERCGGELVDGRCHSGQYCAPSGKYIFYTVLAAAATFTGTTALNNGVGPVSIGVAAAAVILMTALRFFRDPKRQARKAGTLPDFVDAKPANDPDKNQEEETLRASHVIEHALLPVIPGMEAEFEAAMREALPLVQCQPGFLWVQISRSIEQPSQYLLLMGWETVEAHEEGFRKSAEYQRWRELLHRFYSPFPQVGHFEPTIGDFE